MNVRLALLSLLVALLGACTPPASEGGFDSDNPASKLYAIRRAGDQGDRAAIPKLVEQLDSDDPAVRLMAIEALERLTGARLDYNPYSSDEARESSIEAWQRAVKEGRFAATRPSEDRSGKDSR